MQSDIRSTRLHGMASFDLDCLFVHVPKADNHYLPFGDFFNITYMPMGVTAIAEVLQRSGKRVEVIHLGVEWLEDPDKVKPGNLMSEQAEVYIGVLPQLTEPEISALVAYIRGLK